MIKNETVHVVGGGLVGPLTAIFLAKNGFDVSLYERREDLRKEKLSAGKSINLVVTERGLKALDYVGLKDTVLDIAIPMKGRMLHDDKGIETFVPYGQKDNEVIYAISRGLLNQLLLTATDSYENLEISFNHHCTEYDIPEKQLIFKERGNKDLKKIDADVVIGTDGAWSPVRRAMLRHVEHFNYSQNFLDCGYKELVIPAGKNGEFQLEKGALHIWPRTQHMLIALPNMDGSFTCTLFLPFHGEESFDTLQTATHLTEFFAEHYADAMALMPTLKSDFFDNETGSLVTVKCSPWHADGQAAVMGDAAHAIVPFFGQGMNCGFEDCTALGDILEKDLDNWEEIFKNLEQSRKINSDAIADMALENFIEMRDTTANPKFQLKKKIGFALEQRYGDKFTPRYSMVMFHSDIPYAKAKYLSEVQDIILNKLSENITSVDQLDWDMAEQLVNEMIEEHSNCTRLKNET